MAASAKSSESGPWSAAGSPFVAAARSDSATLATLSCASGERSQATAQAGCLRRRCAAERGAAGQRRLQRPALAALGRGQSQVNARSVPGTAARRSPRGPGTRPSFAAPRPVVTPINGPDPLNDRRSLIHTRARKMDMRFASARLRRRGRSCREAFEARRRGAALAQPRGHVEGGSDACAGGTEVRLRSAAAGCWPGTNSQGEGSGRTDLRASVNVIERQGLHSLTWRVGEASPSRSRPETAAPPHA